MNVSYTPLEAAAYGSNVAKRKRSRIEILVKNLMIEYSSRIEIVLSEGYVE